MTQCPALFAFNSEGNLHAVKCGQWSCVSCAKDLARLWAWRCRLHVEQANTQAYFWTFTMGSRVRTAARGYAILPTLWDNLRKTVQRSCSDWSYCAFVEGQTHRGNMPHFHVISMISAPRRIKDLAVQCGFGYQATQTPINSQKAANYCAKYASKTNPATPKGFRRVRASQDWAKMPPYDGEPLIVRGKRELLSDYLLRVHWKTGVDIDDLLYVWTNQLYTNDVTNITTSLCKDVA